MNARRFLFVSLAAASLAALISLTLPSAAHAQVFTPIFQDYSCAQLTDGSQILVRIIPGGYEYVSSKAVKKVYNDERHSISNSLRTVNGLLKDFENERISKSK